MLPNMKHPDHYKYMAEVEEAVVDCLRPFSGQEVNQELIQEMVNALYNGISSTGLKVNVAGYEEHIDVNITHPDGPKLFEANIQLGIKGTINANPGETAPEADRASE